MWYGWKGTECRLRACCLAEGGSAINGIMDPAWERMDGWRLCLRWEGVSRRSRSAACPLGASTAAAADR